MVQTQSDLFLNLLSDTINYSKAIALKFIKTFSIPFGILSLPYFKTDAVDFSRWKKSFDHFTKVLHDNCVRTFPRAR